MRALHHSLSRTSVKLMLACACLLVAGSVAQAKLISYSFVMPDFVPDLDAAGNPTSNLNDASIKVIFNTSRNRAEIHARSHINNGTRRNLHLEDTYVGEVFDTGYDFLEINSDIIKISAKGTVEGVARSKPVPV